jgi:hypothetical protein
MTETSCIWTGSCLVTDSICLVCAQQIHSVSEAGYIRCFFCKTYTVRQLNFSSWIWWKLSGDWKDIQNCNWWFRWREDICCYHSVWCISSTWMECTGNPNTLATERLKLFSGHVWFQKIFHVLIFMFADLITKYPLFCFVSCFLSFILK